MSLDLATVSIGDIVPYDHNPRKNDAAVDAVVESINQCGYCAPIVVDENMVILAGHTRYKAMERLGWDECQVVIRAGMTDEQKRKYRILDNKTNEFADWDLDILAEEMADLDFGDFDFGLDIDLEVETHATEAVDDGYDAEPPEEPKAKRGDIYQLGRHRLMCGDSTSIGDIRKLAGGANIDVLLTSPPYGLGDCAGLREKYERGKSRLKSLYNAHDDESTTWSELMDGFFARPKKLQPCSL